MAARLPTVPFPHGIARNGPDRLVDRRVALLGSGAMTTHDRPFGRHLEDFVPGDVYKHRPGQTNPEYVDHLFSMITMNTNPFHTNEWFPEHQNCQGKHGSWDTLVYSPVLSMSVRTVTATAP